jgi:putative component of toxin-antitoxin plasmid stabilization module
MVIVLLAGGGKSTQNQDIRTARALARELKEETDGS